MESPITHKDQKLNPGLQNLAQDLLYRLKLEKEVPEQVKGLAAIDPEVLERELSDDEKRKAFWINLYNGYNLLEMRKHPEVNENHRSRMKHFMKRQFVVAGQTLSLMDMENGILRRSKAWWGLGYVPRLFTSSFERKMRVDTLDPRVHFALNCGAMSCPPIRFYTPENIEAELELATQAYLMTEVKTGEGTDQDTLYISSLFRAYRGDFRKAGGVMAFIYQYKELPVRKWKRRFITWDSTADLGDFIAS